MKELALDSDRVKLTVEGDRKAEGGGADPDPEAEGVDDDGRGGG